VLSRWLPGTILNALFPAIPPQNSRCHVKLVSTASKGAITDD